MGRTRQSGAAISRDISTPAESIRSIPRSYGSTCSSIRRAERARNASPRQYARANYTPSERYVLDLPGTNRYRLEADTSGYDNLALAGDWIFTGLGGAVESAVMAGMQAARALTGVPQEIVGESKSPWRRKRTLKPLL